MKTDAHVEGGRLVPEWEYFWPALLACAHAAQTCREVVSRINNTAAMTIGRRMEYMKVCKSVRMKE